MQEIHLEMGTMTVSNAAIPITHATFAFTAANLLVAETAYISCTGGNMRLMTTGDHPTATVGVPCNTTGLTVVTGNVNINRIELIRESVDAVATIILTRTL
jgi:hypothetical protein